MITGMIIGFSFGITLTTLMWSMMLIKGGKRRAENDKKVEALLVRKAEGVERIASILENNSNASAHPHRCCGTCAHFDSEDISGSGWCSAADHATTCGHYCLVWHKPNDKTETSERSE